MLDVDNPHTWDEVKRMSLNEVWLTNELFDARDEARVRAEKRRRQKEASRE